MAALASTSRTSLSSDRARQPARSANALPRAVKISTCHIQPAWQVVCTRTASVQHTGRNLVKARAAEEEPMDEPEMSQDAIQQGLKLSNAGKWEEALEMYERALKLPGTGMKRFRDKPRVASDRERMTALYNIACCHSQLKDTRSGLVALAGCLELGYADYPQIRRDPDLQLLRTDERFETLMKRFEPSKSLFDLGSIFGRK